MLNLNGLWQTSFTVIFTMGAKGGGVISYFGNTLFKKFPYELSWPVPKNVVMFSIKEVLKYSKNIQTQNNTLMIQPEPWEEDPSFAVCLVFFFSPRLFSEQYMFTSISFPKRIIYIKPV